MFEGTSFVTSDWTLVCVSRAQPARARTPAIASTVPGRCVTAVVMLRRRRFLGSRMTLARPVKARPDAERDGARGALRNVPRSATAASAPLHQLTRSAGKRSPSDAPRTDAPSQLPPKSLFLEPGRRGLRSGPSPARTGDRCVGKSLRCQLRQQHGDAVFASVCGSLVGHAVQRRQQPSSVGAFAADVGFRTSRNAYAALTTSMPS